METVDVIEIDWEGPLASSEVMEKRSEDWDFGVYQIYGTHNVLGPETLLYIGKAVERPFAQRVSEHRAEWTEWEASDVRVYLGRIGGLETMTKEGWPDWNAKIARAERLSIYFCAPPYNSQGLSSYGQLPPTVVLNYHRRNRLPLEVSTLYESSALATKPQWKPYGK